MRQSRTAHNMLTSCTALLIAFTTLVTASDQVCFDFVGCFMMGPPWFSFTRPLPSPNSPEEINTRFYLYTRSAPERYNVITRPNVSLNGSDFDGDRKTFFITHGFSANGNSSWMLDMKDAILKAQDANVFVVDWGEGAEKLNYFQVASNTRVAGEEGIRVSKYLVDHTSCDPSRMHLIGHSLGAHISSYIAKQTPGLARLTALDPAQPMFEGFDPRVRLAETDAVFVDVLHTDAKPFVPFIGFGMMGRVGHVDFYMNDGCNQPGCLPVPAMHINLAKAAVEVIEGIVVCPHGRSYRYFTEAIANPNCTFWGHTADMDMLHNFMLAAGHWPFGSGAKSTCSLETCTPVGLHTPEYPARGVFAVKTTAESPFCIKDEKADRVMEKDMASASKH